jgi:hypothetical protein
MDGFKNSTKTNYDTASGRKFARGGMTVSRNDMAGGQGPMNKPAMVAKYKCGGPVKKAMGGAVPATAATTATPTTTAAPATSNLGPITRENLAARKAANTAAKVARGNITGTPAAAAAPKLGPITRENLAARKAANTAAKIARGNTTGMAKGGSVKMREGGVFNEKGKRATWDEVAAEGRRMEGRKPPVEGISTRPTDSSGRRMTNKELGMTPGGVDTAKRKGVPAHSSKPMIRRNTGGLAVMPKGKC